MDNQQPGPPPPPLPSNPALPSTKFGGKSARMGLYLMEEERLIREFASEKGRRIDWPRLSKHGSCVLSTGEELRSSFGEGETLLQDQEQNLLESKAKDCYRAARFVKVCPAFSWCCLAERCMLISCSRLRSYRLKVLKEQSLESAKSFPSSLFSSKANPILGLLLISRSSTVPGSIEEPLRLCPMLERGRLCWWEWSSSDKVKDLYLDCIQRRKTGYGALVYKDWAWLLLVWFSLVLCHSASVSFLLFLLMWRCFAHPLRFGSSCFSLHCSFVFIYVFR